MNMLFFIVLFFFCCSSKGVPEGEVVARVNDSFLTKEMLREMVGAEVAGPKTFLHATNRWVEKTLLLGAAAEAGLEKDKNLIKQRDSFYKDLLVSSFVEIKTREKQAVLKKDVADYYYNNKKIFIRESEEVVVKHFVFKTKKDAEGVIKKLKRKKVGEKTEKILQKHKPTTRHLKERLLKDSLVGFVFKAGVGAVLGPKKHLNEYHVFQVLKKFSRGSEMGLEVVYDEIYQRLFKLKEASVLVSVLDSLYIKSDVFISSEAFE